MRNGITLSGQDITVCIFADGFSFAVILSAVSFTTQSSQISLVIHPKHFPKPGILKQQDEEIPCTASRYANSHTKTSKVHLSANPFG